MRRLDALFKDNAELQALANQTGRLAELQKTWSEVVPQPLQPFTRAGGLQHRRITVFADNGAVAAKLKLLAPNLLKSLQIKGLEVTSIRVEVQVKSQARASAGVARHLSSKASASLEKLAEKLPDSPLRTALERLAKRG
ncbi:MAG TPA: DciA family protein [Methylophilaceae bacterium]|nr:DciA family protein [Methylophilaceae bacterium]HQR60727.1 DciA family protein [Methylophilaceae bacterium]